jgi:hypothetical protein
VGVLLIRVLVHIYCVLYCLYCFCVDSFMYIYSYLFGLNWCKDYYHGVTTQLQLIIIIIIIIKFGLLNRCGRDGNFVPKCG